MEPGLGGDPEITREDILTALGYASHMTPSIGADLILARYADDEIAKKALVPRLTGMSWLLWLERRRRGRTSLQVHQSMAKLAVRDWVDPQSVGKQGLTWMARYCKVDHRTWKNKYQKHYGELMTLMSIYEGPTFAKLIRALDRQAN